HFDDFSAPLRQHGIRSGLNQVGILSFELYLVHVIVLQLVAQSWLMATGQTAPQSIWIQLVEIPISLLFAACLHTLNQRIYSAFKL
ncbi:MAG: hypothetical protein ACO4AJ_09960, partial [Prochlorothrix sp.]